MQTLTDLVTHIITGLGIEQFPLIEQHNDGATGGIDPLCQPLILRRHAYRRINNEHRDIGPIDRLKGTDQ